MTFHWDAWDLASAYWIDVGSTPGGSQYHQVPEPAHDRVLSQSERIAHRRQQVYVTMYSQIGGQWVNNQSTYTSGP